MSDPVTVPLSRPLQSIDRELTALSIREPTGKDLNACGYPMTFRGDGSFVVDPASMSKLIARCGNVTADAVDAMPIGDWNSAMGAMMGFFGVTAPEKSEKDISSAPAGGVTEQVSITS